MTSRREGTSVYYRVSDPRTLQLLELARAIIASTLEQNQALLDDLAVEEFAPGQGPRLTVSALGAAALAGALAIAVGGVVAAMRDRLRAGLLVQAAGMLLLGVVGLVVLTDGERRRLGVPEHASRRRFGLDPLSGFFLARARADGRPDARVRARLPARQQRQTGVSAR